MTSSKRGVFIASRAAAVAAILAAFICWGGAALADNGAIALFGLVLAGFGCANWGLTFYLSELHWDRTEERELERTRNSWYDD